jgi:Cdc6-like AAA superfamily ATPase
MIADAAGDAEKAIRDAHIERLLSHQKIVYDVVCESDEWLTTTDVYEGYSERVDGDPRSNRTIRKYLSKLAEYDLIAKEGTTRGRTYRSLQ